MVEFTNIVDGFDQCEPPFCPEDISININQFECIDGMVYVSWVVNDIHNRNLSPGINKVFYSLNSVATINDSSATAERNGNSYQSFFNKPNGSGLIYIKVKIEVNNTFFYAETDPINTESCWDNSTVAVRTQVCLDYYNKFGSPGFFIWIKRSGVPQVLSSLQSIYFEYGGACWLTIPGSHFNPTLIEDIPTSPFHIILDSINSGGATQKNNCLGCTLEKTCPTQWIEDPQNLGIEGKYRAEVYIEYTTYTCRDNIIVYGPDNGECIESNKIWETGCVGTCRKAENIANEIPIDDPDCNNYPCDNDGNEGIGTYINDPTFYRGLNSSVEGFRASDIDKDICVKQTCFTMRREQLPITVGIDSICGEPGCSTWWCVYIEGPDFSYSKCGGDEGDCNVVDDSIGWSSSSTSSTSSSSSSTSSSSSSISSSSSSISSSSMSSSSSSISSSSSSISSSSSSISSSSVSSSSSSISSSSTSSSSETPLSGAAFRVLTEEELRILIEKYQPQMIGMSNEEKEEFLINLVIIGELNADEALSLAQYENLPLET